MKKSNKRHKKLKLTQEEIAFFDALADNDSAKEMLGDKTLMKIAHELADVIKKNVNVDWTLRENIQAELRVKIKRLLRKYDYPPDKTKKATELVLNQATLFGDSWAKK